MIVLYFFQSCTQRISDKYSNTTDSVRDKKMISILKQEKFFFCTRLFTYGLLK